MKIISSTDNKTVKLIKKLGEKKGRDKENLFIVEGEKLVAEAIDNGAEIEALIHRGSEIEGFQLHSSVEVAIMTEEVFDSLADTVTPQPIMAIVRKPHFDISTRNDLILNADSKKNGYIVLDSLQDPGNVGTIIRTAEAAGYNAVIAVKGTADPYSQKVVRAAAGAIFKIPIMTMNPQEALDFLEENNIRPIICEASGNNSHSNCDLRGRVAIVVGNEGNGLSEYFQENIKESIKIDMQENSESLNVAIAAAIIMFEKRRQEETIGD